MMPIQILCSFLVTLLIAAAAAAQGKPADRESKAAEPAPVSCASAQDRAIGLIEAAANRLESARQTNQPAALRAALDDVHSTLAALRGHLTSCGLSAPVADPHAGHSAAPKSPSARRAVDPVCGMEVDSATAPWLNHEGTTYYFCSTADRDKFLAAPRLYIKKQQD